MRVRVAVPIGKQPTIIVAVLAVTLALMVIGTAPGSDQQYPTVRLTPAIVSAVVTAAPVNTTTITVTWGAVAGSVQNYTLMYARFYGLPIAYISVGVRTVYNVTDLAPGLTYYFTVWAWEGGTEGPPSNVAAAQTDPLPPIVTPFPWAQLDAITTLSILGSLAFAAVIATVISGRRSRRAEGAAAVALARTNPPRTQGEINVPSRQRTSQRANYPRQR